MRRLRLAVVGDIGGTHARFGLVDLSEPPREVRGPLTLLCSDYPSIDACLDAYLGLKGEAGALDAAAIAVAGPIVEGAAALTNMPWRVSAAGLRAYGFGRAALVNDYAALAFGAPHLGEEDTHLVGPERRGGDGTVAVLGPGTGFGAAILARDAFGQTAVATEGGHVGFAPTDAIEIDILRILAARFGRVSIERILSGPGLVNLHVALAEIAGVRDACAGPAEITARALAGDALATQTLARFFAILGSTAGDFALGYGARGGVYIAGGIAPRLLDILDASEFRSRFEAKGRFEAYVAAIPTRVILHPYLALVGAAQALAQVAG